MKIGSVDYSVVSFLIFRRRKILENEKIVENKNARCFSWSILTNW